jgi:hypothetical protein
MNSIAMAAIERPPGRPRALAFRTEDREVPARSYIPTLPAVELWLDGAEAGPAALRLLRAAPRLSPIYLHVRRGASQWSRPGPLRVSQQAGEHVALRAGNLGLLIEPRAVVAISWCEEGGTAGIRLFEGETGTLTLWSPDGAGLRRWAEAVLD